VVGEKIPQTQSGTTEIAPAGLVGMRSRRQPARSGAKCGEPWVALVEQARHLHARYEEIGHFFTGPIRALRLSFFTS
jgi:hypothetical protein